MQSEDEESPPPLESCVSITSVLVCPLISVAVMGVHGKSVREMATPAAIERVSGWPFYET